MEIIDLGELINLLFVLGVAAAVAGFLAGLLGVGGGIIMVPALYYAFTVLDFDIVTRMHLSVGTSLAIIIPTSIISTKTHMEYDAVDFKMVKSFGIFILFGVIAGTFLAVNLKTAALVLFFSLVVYFLGTYLLLSSNKNINSKKKFNLFSRIITGFGSGFVSASMGIGGAVMNVPVLRYFGYPIKKAIGSAAAIGLIISMAGAIGFIISGSFLDANLIQTKINW